MIANQAAGQVSARSPVLDRVARVLLAFGGDVGGRSPRQHIPSQGKVLIVAAERLGLLDCQ
jgi:hypothetical protein